MFRYVDALENKCLIAIDVKSNDVQMKQVSVGKGYVYEPTYHFKNKPRRYIVLTMSSAAGKSFLDIVVNIMIHRVMV